MKPANEPRTFTPLLCALLLAFGGAAPGAREFSLDEALALAAANNTSLAAKKTALEQARRTARFSWNALLPSVSVSGGLSQSHELYKDPSETDPASWNARGGVSLTFSSDVPAQMKLAAVNLSIEEEVYGEAERALVSEVSTKFYELLADRDNLAILKDALVLAQNQYEETKRKHERGLASELDLLNAEYTWRTAGQDADDAGRVYEKDLAQFLLTIGADSAGEALETPSGEIAARLLALPAVEQLAARHLEKRADVKQAALSAEAAKLTSLAKSLSSRAPTLSLSESVALSPADSGFSGLDTAKGTFSLSVSVPLSTWLPFSSDGLSVKARKEDAATAEAALAAARKQAALDIREKAGAVEQAAAKIDSAEMNFRIASRAYELSRQGYGAGLVSQTDLLSSRQRMVSARQAALQAGIGHISAVYAMASALGMSAGEIYGLYGREK